MKFTYTCVFLCKIYAHQLNQTVKRRNEFLNGHKLLLLVFVFYIVWIILVSWCSIKCYWTLQIADKNITGLFILHFFCTLRFVAFSNYLITNVLKSIYNQMKQSMCSMAVIHYLRMKTFFPILAVCQWFHDKLLILTQYMTGKLFVIWTTWFTLNVRSYLMILAIVLDECMVLRKYILSVFWGSLFC